MRVGIVGGTGPAGKALAARLASVGVSVVIGSRSPDRAKESCKQIRERWPQHRMWLEPAENAEAAAAELVVVATPWDAAPDTVKSLASEVAGKVVVSMANALTREDGEFRAVIPPTGSVAAGVQEAAPDALVSAAFHHLPAKALGDLSRQAQGDVLVCSDHSAAVDATIDMVRLIPGLRPLHAGSLVSAVAVEAFTAVILGVNARYKARATLGLLGLET